MKICTLCKESKPLDEFSPSGKKGSGHRNSQCKLCRRGYWKGRYDSDPTYRGIKINASSAHRGEMKVIVDDLRNVPCADCGNSYPPYVMDFDHLNPTEKIGSVCEMASRGVPKEIILEEVAKCEVVCSNCHRERTYGKK